jgi:hypothetical protein
MQSQLGLLQAALHSRSAVCLQHMAEQLLWAALVLLLLLLLLLLLQAALLRLQLLLLLPRAALQRHL